MEVVQPVEVCGVSVSVPVAGGQKRPRPDEAEAGAPGSKGSNGLNGDGTLAEYEGPGDLGPGMGHTLTLLMPNDTNAQDVLRAARKEFGIEGDGESEDSSKRQVLRLMEVNMMQSRILKCFRDEQNLRDFALSPFNPPNFGYRNLEYNKSVLEMEDPLNVHHMRTHEMRWVQIVFFSLPNGDRRTSNTGGNDGNNGPYAHFELLPHMTYILPTDDVAALVQRLLPRVDPRVAIDETRCAVFDADSNLNWVTVPTPPPDANGSNGSNNPNGPNANANANAEAPVVGTVGEGEPQVSTPPMPHGPAGNDDAYLAGLESKEGDRGNSDVDVDGPTPPPGAGNEGSHPTQLWQLLDWVWTTHRGYPHGAPHFRPDIHWPVIGFERPKRQTASYKYRRTEVGIKIKA